MRMSNLSDRQLVALFQNGRPEAFEELLGRYKSRVYAKIRMYIKDRAEVDDLFQDTFVKAIHALKEGTYNEEGKFSAWVLRIAHNLCIDHFRFVKKMPMKRSTEEFDVFEHVPCLEKNAGDSGHNKQVLQDTKKLLAHLPEDQRQVVMMRLYYDMSFKEISETLNISINTALGRMRYALINLRKIVEKNNIALQLS